MKKLYWVDLETTVDGGPEGDSPEAHWLNNQILLCGWMNENGNYYVADSSMTLCSGIQNDIAQGDEPIVVAHNAKFDLKYLMRDCPWVEWHKVGVWCTMTWQYLYSGHQDKFMSLEKACEGWGILYKKGLDLGALLAAGVKMQDIPKDDLAAYLKDDVLYLYGLYNEQAVAMSIPPFMDYILPLCEMELNGLPVNTTKVTSEAYKLTVETEQIFKIFKDWIKWNCEWQDGTAITDEDFSDLIGTKSKCIKPMANRTLSFILYGQPEELKITPKWRVQYKQSVAPLYSPQQAQAVYGHTTCKGVQGFPMSESDLDKLANLYGRSPLVQEALEYRSKHKILGTYYAPFLATSKIQGAVYPKLNTTGTNTGRLSSSAPNGQNIPPSVRECIIPDDDQDELTEIDFSQLEMIGAATLSGDKQMIKDINDGEDLHYNTGRSVMGWTSPSDMVDKDRKLVKNVNFGLLYGGKANGLSQQTGVEKALVQSLIDGFYSRYPRVKEWQEELFKYVKQNTYAYEIKDGEQRHASLYVLPASGRRFTFVEGESPKWMRSRSNTKWSYSPQQTANYPIQGFAGGDIVMYSLYWLWVVVRNTPEYNDKVKFRMTVHDSILLQTEKGLLLEKLVEAMCTYTSQHFNLPVPLHCDIETGEYWQ